MGRTAKRTNESEQGEVPLWFLKWTKTQETERVKERRELLQEVESRLQQQQRRPGHSRTESTASGSRASEASDVEAVIQQEERQQPGPSAASGASNAAEFLNTVTTVAEVHQPPPATNNTTTASRPATGDALSVTARNTTMQEAAAAAGDALPPWICRGVTEKNLPIPEKPSFDASEHQNPVKFIKSLEIYGRAFQLSDRGLLQIAKDCLKGKAKKWTAIYSDEWVSFADFKEDFLMIFWSKSKQREIRQKISTGRYDKARGTMFDHFAYFADIAKGMKNTMSESDFLDDMMRHFPEDIQARWSMSKIGTIKEAAAFLISQEVPGQNPPLREPPKKTTKFEASTARTATRAGAAAGNSVTNAQQRREQQESTGAAGNNRQQGRWDRGANVGSNSRQQYRWERPALAATAPNNRERQQGTRNGPRQQPATRNNENTRQQGAGNEAGVGSRA